MYVNKCLSIILGLKFGVYTTQTLLKALEIEELTMILSLFFGTLKLIAINFLTRFRNGISLAMFITKLCKEYGILIEIKIRPTTH